MHARYVAEMKDHYATLPIEFFKLMARVGKEKALERLDDMSQDPPPSIGGGEGGEASGITARYMGIDLDAVEAEAFGDDEEAPASGQSDGTYSIMNIEERAEFIRNLKKVRKKTDASTITKEEKEEEEEEEEERVPVSEPSFHQTSVSSSSSAIHTAALVPYHKRCLLMKDMHSRFMMHMVDPEGKEKAFHRLQERFAPYLANAEAYKKMSIEEVQNELKDHAKTPQSWCNILRQCGVMPRFVTHDKHNATILIKSGFIDPPAEDIGSIYNENFAEATHMDMTGIKDDHISFFLMLGFLETLEERIIIGNVEAFQKMASHRMVVLRAYMEETFKGIE